MHGERTYLLDRTHPDPVQVAAAAHLVKEPKNLLVRNDPWHCNQPVCNLCLARRRRLNADKFYVRGEVTKMRIFCYELINPFE